MADLDARGELRSQQVYEYEGLIALPQAGDLIASFSAAIWQTPEEIDCDTLVAGYGVSCRWRASAPTAGILTLRCDQMLSSLSLLASGLDADADRITLLAFQKVLLQELHDTGYEPAFDLLSLAFRPLVATINVRSPADAGDQMTVALADRCFAASYFRYQGLV